MYQKKQVIKQTDGMTDKVYHRRLFGRIFTLHRMIEKRGVKIGKMKEEVYGYEEEIRSLERKIKGVKKDISKVRKGINEIQKEIGSYRNKVEVFKEYDELLYKPSYSVRTYQRGKKGYWYIEGRVRLPMVNGRKGKELTKSFGRYENVITEYRKKDKELYKYLDVYTDGNGKKQRIVDYKLQGRLEEDLEDWWWDGVNLYE
jgi:chromosome segregation ATPase